MFNITIKGQFPETQLIMMLLNMVKTVCILSDSICKRIKINEFNKIFNNKKAYKRCFEGADTKALQHYVTHTINSKPDIVIINVGSNNMRRDKPVCMGGRYYWYCIPM